MPNIKKITKGNDLVEISLSFSKDSEYFKGHFPEFPVLPGFVQVGFAINLAAEHLGIRPDISSIKRLKFTHIIHPEITLNLTLRYSKGANTLIFSYYDSNHSYSSGQFCLNS